MLEKPITREDFKFWIDYTSTSIEEVAERAHLSYGCAEWIIGGAEQATRDIDAVLAVLKAGVDLIGDVPEDIAAQAGMIGPARLARFRYVYDSDGPPTFEDYMAVHKVVGELIDGPARQKMLAYAEAHNLP